LVVGGWSSLVAMLVGVEVYQVCFGENAMNSSGAGNLRIFVGV